MSSRMPSEYSERSKLGCVLDRHSTPRSKKRTTRGSSGRARPPRRRGVRARPLWVRGGRLARVNDSVWRLHHAGRVVAELPVTEASFPWLAATVVALPGFEQVAGLFAAEAGLLDALGDEETAEWTAAYEEIRDQTSLADPTGRFAAEYLLHIDGDRAWWRWSDTRFDE